MLSKSDLAEIANMSVSELEEMVKLWQQYERLSNKDIIQPMEFHEQYRAVIKELKTRRI